MLKKITIALMSGLMVVGVNFCSFAQDEFEFDEYAEEVSDVQDDEYSDIAAAEALNDYVVEGSLFERITMLEQEKVVMQLEKERAQLDLELERLNAEKIKLQMELDTLSGRAEQQQHELEAAKAQLDIQTERLRRQQEELENQSFEPTTTAAAKPAPQRQEESDIGKKYKLINVVGVGNQLQATIEDVASGQNKRISVGKELDGYIVKSISLNDGIVLEKNGETESLNVGK